MQFKKLIALSFLVFGSALAQAEEADEFIRTTQLPPSANALVNQLVNQELKYLRDRINTDSRASCDRKYLIDRFLARLNGNNSKIGDRLKAAVTDQQTSNLFRIFDGNSVYHGIPEVKYCCIATLNLSNTPVGIDKVDHFFGNAGMLWQEWENRPENERSESMILQMAANQEEGDWGIAMTGVKSYGDIGANWSGFKFYRQLLDGPNPFFTCKDNRLELIREFKIEDFINKTWTESVNCSAFRTAEIAKTFVANLKLRGMTCPSKPSDCEEIMALYEKEPIVQRGVISPSCYSGRKIEDSVEAPAHHDWTQLGVGAQSMIHYIMDRRARGAK